MKAKCILCEKIDILDNDSFEAKKLINHPISTYMCTSCTDKISVQTKKRMKTGQYKVYKGETSTEII